MIHSKAQIVATIGPASEKPDVLKAMVNHQVDVVRLNFSWGNIDERIRQINLIRKIEAECGRHIPIIVDLPGPRVQGKDGHTYNHKAISSLTDEDKGFIQFAAQQKVDYIALSFVGSAEDVKECRAFVKAASGTQKIIAKIERAVAVDALDEIMKAADAVMVARGDLGNEVELERIPFVQDSIIKKAKKAGKPVIVATQMMLSMVDNPLPTRAEVTDVANAILQGADAVMLSEESARGTYPIEVVTMMEKIVIEAEKHTAGQSTTHHL